MEETSSLTGTPILGHFNVPPLVMHCNMPRCNVALRNEGFVMPCKHVVCGDHSPWRCIEGQSRHSPTGIQCPVCRTAIIDERKLINITNRSSIKSNGRGLMGVHLSQAFRMARTGISLHLTQMDQNLRKKFAAARRARAAKQRRIEELRAKAARMHRVAAELVDFLERKRIEEANSKRQAEFMRRRLQAAFETYGRIKGNARTLKWKVSHWQEVVSLHYVDMDKAKGERRQIIRRIETIRRSTYEVRPARSRPSRRDQRDHPYRQEDRYDRYDAGDGSSGYYGGY